MSFAFFDEAKERIRESVEIADLVRSYIELKPKGPNFAGLCPFHRDTTPSLNVTPSRGTWWCYVCNVGGDIFSFVEKIEGVSFPEAVRMLADRAGIDLPKTGRYSPEKQAETRDKKRHLLEIAAWAEQLFHDCLLNDSQAVAAREYLEGRGISLESIERYRLGFAPDSWSWLLDEARRRKYEPQNLLDVALVKQNDRGGYYDFFRGRVIFPIHDEQGRPIAFGGRVLPQDADKGAKYLNSADTPLFKKSRQLYGFDVVRSELQLTRTVTVMEGYTDVVMARQMGVMDPVAVLGTAFGEGHIKLLRRFVDRVTLVLDGDEAGRKRTNEMLNLFIANDLDLRVLTLPDELDPCDYVAKFGAQAFTTLTEQAPDALEKKLQSELEGINPLRDTHLASRAIENVLEALALLPRGSDQQRSREMMALARLSRTFQVSDDELRKRLASVRSRQKTRRWVAEEPTVIEPVRREVPAADRELLEILLLAPELAPQVIEEVETAELSHPVCQQVYEVIREQMVAGAELEFRTLLDSLPSDDQSVLVQIDDESRKKAEAATATPAERWQMWRTSRAHKKYLQQSQEKRGLLQSTEMNDSEALDVLKALWETNKARTQQEKEELQQPEEEET